MIVKSLIVTAEGLTASIAASNLGTQLSITTLGLHDGTTEFKVLPITAAGQVGAETYHITARDFSTDVYNVRRINLYDTNSVLFAYYEQATDMLQKTAEANILIAADFLLTTVPPGSVTIVGNEFAYNPASDDQAGIVELAISSEMDVGDDINRVPPVKVVADYVAAKIAAAVKNATTLVKGIVELATATEMNAEADTTRVPTVKVVADYVQSKFSSFTYTSATKSTKGIVELATATEMTTGTDTTRTPAVKVVADYVLTRIAAAVKNATSSVKGIVELAVTTEMNTGTDTTRVPSVKVVADYVAARIAAAVVNATAAAKGIVELATSSEMTTGSDTTRVTTVKVVADYVAAKLSSFTYASATTTTKGILELANSTETIAAIDGERGVTPAGLAAALVNSLTSTSTKRGLTAAQGKALRDLINSLNYGSVGAAAAAHNHSASNINSGTMSVNRLPVGSASVRGALKSATLSAGSFRDNETGWIIKFGTVNMNGGNNNQSVIFDDSFPVLCQVALMFNNENVPTEGNIGRVGIKSKSNFSYHNGGGNTYTAWDWIAIGK